MSIPSQSRDEILKRITAFFRTSFDFPLGTKRFLGRMARSVALSIWGLQKSIEDIDLDIVPSPQSSSDALTAWAVLLGLPDGEGGFGRLLPTAASGGTATFTGVKGTVFADGTLATAEDGTEIEVSGAVTITGAPPGYGSVSGALIAVTKGSAGNLPAGTVCTWQSTPAGADSTFTLLTALQGGTDLEDNAAVYARIKDRLQTPPRGGVAEDYRLWAQVSGIQNVYVYPRRQGTGSVDIVIAQAGTGQARLPTSAQLLDAQEAVDAKRPVTVESANVIAPYMPDLHGVSSAAYEIIVEVTPASSKYDFDWDDTATSYTVDTYTAGVAPTLKLNTLAPASLKGAIDLYNAGAADAPRLQVLSSGADPVNPPIKAVSWSDGGGKTTLTLESAPEGWTAPTASPPDKVFAYGPVVETIANNIKTFVNNLGPSRVGGYADPLTPWLDQITISGLIAAAENAIDTDGSKLIDKVPVGAATINGTAADVQGVDSVDGPEILYLSHIAIVQA
jgi:uncharacterized phage protein gp47/JayE